MDRGVKAFQPNSERYLPSPDAAERLWQAYARLDPGRATAATWDDAVRPLRRQLDHEESAINLLHVSTWIFASTAVALVRKSSAAAIIGAAGAAAIAATAASRFSDNRSTHPIGKLLKQVWPLPRLDERIDGVMQAFATSIPLFPSADAETPLSERPISPHILGRAFASVLFHSDFPQRRAAAQRLADFGLSRLVVREADVDQILNRIRPIASYLDLIGANDWEIDRAQQATLTCNAHARRAEINGYFDIIRWQGRPERTGTKVKQDNHSVLEFIRERNLPIDMGATRYSQFRNGSHVFGEWFRAY
jgi:hypothetical protein